MRLNKFLAHHGICSRRDADKLIEQGFVKVNHTIMTTPYIVQEDDVISVNGKEITQKPESKIWAFYKPCGLITTHKDSLNRETVFDHPAVQKLGHVISVGRLDINSEGLILLTNDPVFSHYAENPKTKWERVYKVRVFGQVHYHDLDNLRNGITIDGIDYQPIIVQYEEQTSKNHWITMTLTEGKNREIRKVLNFLGLQVSRLIRVAYGPYSLKTLQVGEVRMEQGNRK
jgi:23S rRNA pseudouridine2605 synthase